MVSFEAGQSLSGVYVGVAAADAVLVELEEDPATIVCGDVEEVEVEEAGTELFLTVLVFVP